jgi:hypothetical protein
MELRTRPGSTDFLSVTAEDGSSPRHQFQFQSFLDLPRHFEFSQVLRSVSVLSSQQTPRYETGDLRLAWQALPHLEFAVTAQNLFQPHHVEYGGDPGPLVGIKRNVFGAITWRK